MANNLYIPFHPGDYLTDTAHLSAAEHGAYLLLILNYWQRGEPLPADDRKLRGIARMTAAEWQESRKTVLEFFTERDGLLHHKRIDEELANARDKSSKAKASAEQSVNVRRANAKRPLNERSANQDQDQEREDKEAKASSSSADDDERILISEAMRRLEQATGWLGLPGEGAIKNLLDEGVSFDGRILPLAKDEAERRTGPPKGWSYIAAVVRDKSRQPTPSAKEVETAWVPVGSGVWKALCGIKRESFLRQMAKPGPGGEGIYWPVADLPKADSVAA
jgi:uncharacterized protein YdaU (DUF1376 family)